MDLQPGEELAAAMDLPVVQDPGSKGTAPPLFKWQTQRVVGALAESQTVVDGSSEPQKAVNGGGNAYNNKKVERKSPSRASNSKPANFAELRPDSTSLGDVASVLRSKNAGPYEVTFDVMFESEEVYRIIKDSNLLTDELVQKSFNLKPEEVLYCGFFDQARGWKATIPRKRGDKPAPSGNFLEDDVHGSQQYIPLLRVRVPPEVVRQLQQGQNVHL
jgi:hypothetical protein